MDGGFFALESDPTEVDAYGDGLDDYEETYGIHTVRYTDSPESFRQFLSALYGDGTPGTYLESDYNVQTNPLDADTDDDGLREGEELEFGTNPADSDTDGDGIADSEELEEDTDPTLYDYQGPEIDVFRANFWTTVDPAATHYLVGYSAKDPSGVERIQFVKDGDVKKQFEFDGSARAGGLDEFTTGPVESIDSALGGTTVDVRATDRHDNSREVVALERTNFYGEVAAELPANSMYSRSIADDLGLLSGFATGAGETVEMARTIAEDPLGFLDSITQIVTLLRNLGLLDDLIEALPKQIQEKQDQNNPYDKNTEHDLYVEYRDGWYAGYLSYVVVSTVAGGQATKAAKNTKTFAKLVDKLDRNGKLTTASRYLDAVERKTTGTAKRVTYRLGTRTAKESWALSQQSGRRILSGVETAVGKYRVRQRLSDTSNPTLAKVDEYSPGTQRFVGRFTSRLGSDGKDFVEEADSDDVTQMMEMRRAMTDGGSFTVDDSRLWSYRLAELVGEDDISSSEFGRYLENLEGIEHETRQELVELTTEADTASAAEAVHFTNDYTDLRDELDSTENLNDLYHRALGGDRDNFEGAAFEARYAASKSEDVIAVARDTPDSINHPHPGDVDVLTEEGGERIGYELKSSSDKREIGNIAKGYEEMIENDVVDDYKIVFQREPSDELEQYLESNNIDYEVYTS